MSNIQACGAEARTRMFKMERIELVAESVQAACVFGAWTALKGACSMLQRNSNYY
jgi:hypothetical protein